jgi:hypothetical protein
MATAGRVLGIIGIILSILFAVGIVLLVAREIKSSGGF